MKYIADLHVHSRFSRATAKNLDLEHLYMAARIKGIQLVATGDFTHPVWREEMKEKLREAEPGLFRLKPDIEAALEKEVPSACTGHPRFVLEAEISNIYKKNDKTRKNHNLVFFPDFAAADAFSDKLERLGNIASDGRPILGLDARDLLELVLETGHDGFLIPAHVWTPWFSLLGSKSGFDTVAECFEDLTDHIFALETGLSSNPPMNSRVSALDRYTLVSNSDAHSPAKLGREANFFDTELSFPGLKAALKTGKKPSFLGTLEFYPEEGKYHLDGHRKCNVRLLPQQSRETGGKCPVCGRDLTLGVLYRVEELADRKETDENVPVRPFQSAIPLTEILSEILGKGPATKTVLGQYERILENAGPELLVLNDLPPEEIRKTAPPLLDEALTRMREDRVHLFPGYDGEYGVIRLFDPLELKQLKGQTAMFGKFDRAKNKEKKPDEPPAKPVVKKKKKDLVQTELFGPPPKKTDPLFQLNDDQARAVTHEGGPVLITAGPGTGKTRTLTARVAHLALNKSVDPARILAVTFTNKAAKEMRDRIAGMLAGHPGKPMPVVATFHALCLQWLSEQTDGAPARPARLIDEKSRDALVADAAAGFPHVRPQDAGNRISLAKQKVLLPDEVQDPELSAVYGRYQELLDLFGVWDFDDLLARTVRLLETDPEFRRRLTKRFDHILVDEYQDLNEAQLRIMRSLMPPGQPGHNLFAIGDPDQTIYGFRGSDPAAFADFAADYPDTAIIHLTRNYRSVEAVLSASAQVISGNRPWSDESDHSSRRVYSGIPGVQTITVMEAKSAEAEAAAVARTIESLVGGTGFEAVNAGRTWPTGPGRGNGLLTTSPCFIEPTSRPGFWAKSSRNTGSCSKPPPPNRCWGKKASPSWSV